MVYTDEYGNKLNLSSYDDVCTIINDMFLEVNTENKCICTQVNLKSIIDKTYSRKLEELRSK